MKLVLLAAMTAVFIGGCASVKKAEYPKTASPTEEISRLESDLNRSISKQADVVTPKEIERSQKHLNYAKKELAKGDMNDFWDAMAVSRGYLNRSQELFEKRSPKVTAVLKARELAIIKGARAYDETRDELAALDDSFKKNAKSLDFKNLDKEVWNRAIIDYSALRLNTIREAQVGEARDLIRLAKKKNARYYAPKSLNQAEHALDLAEQAIADNPDTESAFAPAVQRANETARNLIAVNATARKAAGQTNEEVATEIVGRNKTILSLKNEAEGADLEARMTAKALAAKDSNLRGLAAANKGLRSEQEWNEALESARGEFSAEEADVYRQGDKLLIRLKKMNFPSGSAEVPELSEALLSKVSNVIEELNAKNIEVQGHTDSTGSVPINQKLSKERARAVAEYLENEVDDVRVKTVGYGFERPISANKNSAGRATNRRVDIVITPEKARN
jgi:outer membrane protein OmpA-like peptidoglycan-associated protein